ncbi:hypothetical protein ACP4OV_016655 [Aristida adscensionis]
MAAEVGRVIGVTGGAGGFSELGFEEKGSPLPKFGEWDVNDPASGEGFTVIFNKARDEKKTGGNSEGQDGTVKGQQQSSGQGFPAAKADNSTRNGSAAFNLALLNPKR